MGHPTNPFPGEVVLPDPDPRDVDDIHIRTPFPVFESEPYWMGINADDFGRTPRVFVPPTHCTEQCYRCLSIYSTWTNCINDEFSYCVVCNGFTLHQTRKVN